MNKEKKEKKSTTKQKEHQRPWREVYASPEDIKLFLSERVMLRHNVVRGRDAPRTTGTRHGKWWRWWGW